MQLKARLRLRELRLKHQWTQAQVAKQARLSKTTISNLESDELSRIDLNTIARLCEAFDCTPNDLFEVVTESEVSLLLQQKQALNDLLGSVQYNKSVDPNTLDEDLAEIIAQDVQHSQSKLRRRQA
jgi:transcriptional regulator with XRE-family HTH domain